MQRAAVVGDPGVPDVDGNALWGDRVPAAGLTDAEDHIRMEFAGLFQNQLRGAGVQGRDLKFT